MKIGLGLALAMQRRAGNAILGTVQATLDGDQFRLAMSSVQPSGEADFSLSALTLDDVSVLDDVGGGALGTEQAASPDGGVYTGSGIRSAFTGTPVVGQVYIVTVEITAVSGSSVVFVPITGSPFANFTFPNEVGTHHALLTVTKTDNTALLRTSNPVTIGSISCRLAEWTYTVPPGSDNEAIRWTFTDGTNDASGVVYVPEDGVIYVSPNGSDATATGALLSPYRGGSAATAAASPGDEVRFEPGTYAPFEVMASGTDGSPITLTSSDTENQAIITDNYAGTAVAGVEIDSKDYINVTHLTIQDVQRPGIHVVGTDGELHGHHVFANNTIRRVGNAGIFVTGYPPTDVEPASDIRTTDILIEYNDVSETNIPVAYNSNAGGVNEAISVAAGVSFVTTRFNEVHDTDQYGIDYKHGVVDGSIYGNTIYDVEKYGIYIDSAESVCRRIQVYNNNITRCELGIVLAREDDDNLGNSELVDIDVFNNWIYDIQKTGLFCQAHPKDDGSGLIEDIRIRYNTIYNCRRGGVEGDEIRLTGWADAAFAGNVSGVDCVGNLLWRSDGTPSLVDEFTGEAWATVDDNYTGPDPLFVAPSADPVDLRLQEGSPAAGTVSTSYAVAPFNLDYDGEARSGSTAGAAGGEDTNVTLDAISATQYSNIEPVDFSSSVPSGSRAYSIQMPEGLEVMSKALKIIGSPVATQSETTAEIIVVPPSGPNYTVSVPITVTAAGGATYAISTVADLYALTEFGTSYTGAGCIINLAAGATFDLTAYSNSSRFQGLTSPIIIKSADPSDPATITGKGFAFAGASGTVGNVSFVDLIFDIAQTGTTVSPGGSIATQGMILGAGSVSLENIAVIRCQFSSDVGPGSDKYLPKGEIVAIQTGRPINRLTVWGCTFQNLFNGVLGAGLNCLVGRNTMTECWGDLFRVSPDSVDKELDTVLSCDNFLGQSTANGLLRHADGLQMGGNGAGSTAVDFERRGDISSDGLLAELPATAPGFWNANLIQASTNQSATTVDDRLYWMETDVAAGNLTVALPSVGALGATFEQCVQKFSGDTEYSVTVTRNGSDTIDGVAADYVIEGAWKAVRFYRTSATNWNTQVYGPGQQHGLYQDDGGLDSLTGALFWACGTTSSQFAGHSFEVLTSDSEVEYCSLARAVYGDVDGDGILDANDYVGNAAYPAIQLRNPSASAELSVSNSVAATIAKDVSSSGTLTTSNNDTGQTGTTSTVSDRFVGGGARSATRLEAIKNLRHVPGGPLDGSGIGAIWLGLADGPYDFVNMRPRIPGAPSVTTMPVIALGTGEYEITTAPAFSGTVGTLTRQWYLDDVEIDGETGTTLSTTGLASGDVSLRFVGPSALGDCIVETLPVAHVAAPSLAFSDAITLPANNSADMRYTRTTVSRDGYEWMTGSADQSIDSGVGFSLGMSGGTRTALNTAGSFVQVFDVRLSIGETSGLVGLSTRSLAGHVFNNTTYFQFIAGSPTTGAWNATPAGFYDADGFSDVSALYGVATGTVWRVWLAWTLTSTSTRVFTTHNNLATARDFRNYCVFDRATFDADDAVMATEIAALAP